MKFLVHIDDFNLKNHNIINSGQFKLNSGTSVSQLKIEFFNTISKFGDLVQVSNDSLTELTALCSEENTIYVTFNTEPPEGLACRLLRHSLGSFLVSGGYLNGWEIREATVNIVTSERQKNQMHKGLGSFCPNLGIFTPGISDIFERALLDNSIKKSDNSYDLIYTGRIIANKGIVQTVRALNFWPISNANLKLIGDFELDFFIYHSNAYHTTFNEFFKREVLNRSPFLNIEHENAMPHEKLISQLKQAHCFIYPSFHEDENFGLAPREAILCGVPTVVSDFCGLGNLGNTSGGFVKTYPSLAGVRYSLKELSERIRNISQINKEYQKECSTQDAEFVRDECDKDKANKKLLDAVQSLATKSIDPAPTGGWRTKERAERWGNSGNSAFKQAIELKDEPPADGLYVDGTGFPSEGRCFSDAHFMQAIQSLYTTFGSPPQVIKNNVYRGFWRVGLYEDELAVVEFGFPGPRFCRFDRKNWEELKGCAQYRELGEIVFLPENLTQCKIIQKLVDLGYVVPDCI
jgi:glycosyltransferase involved in cell wall biosynthesis